MVIDIIITISTEGQGMDEIFCRTATYECSPVTHNSGMAEDRSRQSQHSSVLEGSLRWMAN